MLNLINVNIKYVCNSKDQICESYLVHCMYLFIPYKVECIFIE